MTINVQIGGHSEEIVQGQLSSGRYADAKDVVDEALRLMAEREHRLAELDIVVDRSRADSAAGRTKPIEEVVDRLRAKYAGMAQERGER